MPSHINRFCFKSHSRKTARSLRDANKYQAESAKFAEFNSGRIGVVVPPSPNHENRKPRYPQARGYRFRYSPTKAGELAESFEPAPFKHKRGFLRPLSRSSLDLKAPSSRPISKSFGAGKVTYDDQFSHHRRVGSAPGIRVPHPEDRWDLSIRQVENQCCQTPNPFVRRKRARRFSSCNARSFGVGFCSGMRS